MAKTHAPLIPEGFDWQSIESRMGPGRLRERLRKQIYHANDWKSQGKGLLKIERIIPIYDIFGLMLKAVGLWDQGCRNYLDFRVIENPVRLKGLPPAFEGYRILHLADLHADLHPDFAKALIPHLKGLHYDICLNTGDFRNKTLDSYEQALRATGEIHAALTQKHLAILGNHDFAEKIPELEAMGIQMLLNEAVCLERGNSRLWVVGIDDPHYYKTHDFDWAERAIPAGEAKLLLAHSPEVYTEAARRGYCFQLSGHTHGGQICLPNGFRPVNHCPVPRAFLYGNWTYGSLCGYTSSGAGGCALPVRFNCPPEIVIHTLLPALS